MSNFNDEIEIYSDEEYSDDFDDSAEEYSNEKNQINLILKRTKPYDKFIFLKKI